jgi:hypothetical protein
LGFGLKLEGVWSWELASFHWLLELVVSSLVMVLEQGELDLVLEQLGSVSQAIPSLSRYVFIVQVLSFQPFSHSSTQPLEALLTPKPEANSMSWATTQEQALPSHPSSTSFTSLITSSTPLAPYSTKPYSSKSNPLHYYS